MSEIIVSPSILSADFANLESEIKKVTSYGAKWIHIDVMDGHFVPNITMGAPVVKSIRKITDAFLDVHLMIENPDKYIDDFISAGSNIITFHIEASKENTLQCIKKIKEKNLLAGISIKPKTDINAIQPYLNLIDMVLIMTVEPGFSGQNFMEDCASKIAEIKSLKPDLKYIQADGGINNETAKICKKMGANCLVAGNYIFKSNDMENAVKQLLD